VSTTPVIFDTDPGIDDAMALIFLNACQKLKLVGITTVFGNASIENCTNNALYLCERFNIAAPVYAGAGLTLTGKSEDDYPDFVHGADGMANINASAEHRVKEASSAHEFLIKAAKEHSGQLTIIAVGRLTNLALAIQADEQFAANVKEIVLMGGAVDVPGNVTEWAEANIIGDPEATDVVFSSGIPTTQVGLDVTMKSLMSESYIADLATRCGDAGKLLNEITPYYLEFYRGRTGENGFACHDSSAVAFVEDPSIYQTKTGDLSVVISGEQRGRTLFKENADGHHKHCVQANAPALMKIYDDYLVRQYS
jgi:purine nucleosidase